MTSLLAGLALLLMLIYDSEVLKKNICGHLTP